MTTHKTRRFQSHLSKIAYSSAIFLVAVFFSSQPGYAVSALWKVRVNYDQVGTAGRTDAVFTASGSVAREPNTRVSMEIYRQTAMSKTSIYSWVISGSRQSVQTNSADSYYWMYVIDADESDAQVLCHVNPNGESGYENGSLFVTVTSAVPTQPDLIVDSITVDGTTSPQTYSVGQQVSVAAIVYNVGQGAAGTSTMGYYIGTTRSDTSSRWATDGCSSLNYNQGSSESASYTFIAADVGTRYFVFKADINNDVTEAIESNNIAYFGPFTVVNNMGTISGFLQPTAAAQNGATWRLTSGLDTGWKTNGASLSTTSGVYTMQFSTVFGWDTPASIVLSVAAGGTVSKTGTYVRQYGSLIGRILPQSASISGGAQWRVTSGTDTTWKASGENTALPVDTYTVEFKTIPAWNTATSVTSIISAGVQNTVTGTYSYSNSLFDQQYYLTGKASWTNAPLVHINVTNVWETSKGNPNVKIGIVDVGFYPSHPDLPSATAQYDLLDGGLVDYERLMPKANHGTLIAGIIAGLHNGVGVSGIAPSCSVVYVRMNYNHTQGSDAAVAEAVNQARSAGCKIISLSMSGQTGTLVRAAVGAAVADGAVVVCSAGTSDGGNTIDNANNISQIPGVIVVGGCTEKGRFHGYGLLGDDDGGNAVEGAAVDLVAPSRWIVSTDCPYPDGAWASSGSWIEYSAISNGMGDALPIGNRISGVSFSTPMVAAAAGLLCSIDPSLSPVDIERILKMSANTTMLQGFAGDINGHDTRFGMGLLDVARAIAIMGSNLPPTNIFLFISTVAENLSVGTTVGSFTTQDPDFTNTFIYTLVSGTGSEDNGSFTISGSALLTAAVFNYEVKSNYSIRVQSADQGGLSTQKVFTINVTNVNEIPTNIFLSSTTVAENLSVGTTVGSFTTQDPDFTNTFTYTLVSGTGSEDNGSFTINGYDLLSADVFNYEVKRNYSIRIQSTDQGGLSTQKVYAINVADVNEPPPSFWDTPSLSGSNMVIRWGSITNKKYTVHYSTNLITGFSVLQSNIPGTPAVNSYTDTLTVVTQKYWKVTTDP